MKGKYTIKILDTKNQAKNDLYMDKETCVIGRSLHSDLRIQLPSVEEKHLTISMENKTFIAHGNDVTLNGINIEINKVNDFEYGDVFGVKDRKFAVECTSEGNAVETSTPAVPASPLRFNTTPGKPRRSLNEEKEEELEIFEEEKKTISIPERKEEGDKIFDTSDSVIEKLQDTLTPIESTTTEEINMYLKPPLRKAVMEDSDFSDVSKPRIPVFEEEPVLSAKESLKSLGDEIIKDSDLTKNPEVLKEVILLEKEIVEEEIQNGLGINESALDTPLIASIKKPVKDLHEAVLERNALKNAQSVLEERESMEDVREEIISNVVSDIKQEVKDNIKGEIKEDLRESFINEVREELRDEIMDVVKEDLVKDFIVEEVIDKIKNEAEAAKNAIEDTEFVSEENVRVEEPMSVEEENLPLKEEVEVEEIPEKSKPAILKPKKEEEVDVNEKERNVKKMKNNKKKEDKNAKKMKKDKKKEGKAKKEKKKEEEGVDKKKEAKKEDKKKEEKTKKEDKKKEAKAKKEDKKKEEKVDKEKTKKDKKEKKEDKTSPASTKKIIDVEPKRVRTPRKASVMERPVVEAKPTPKKTPKKTPVSKQKVESPKAVETPKKRRAASISAQPKETPSKRKVSKK